MLWLSTVVASALMRIVPISVPTALTCVRRWQCDLGDPLCELQRSEHLLLDNRGPHLGCIALVDRDDDTRAIAVFERSDNHSIVLRDICCGDRSSGSLIAKTVSRQPKIRTSVHLSTRWKIAQRFFKSSR